MNRLFALEKLFGSADDPIVFVPRLLVQSGIRSDDMPRFSSLVVDAWGKQSSKLSRDADVADYGEAQVGRAMDVLVNNVKYRLGTLREITLSTQETVAELTPDHLINTLFVDPYTKFLVATIDVVDDVYKYTTSEVKACVADLEPWIQQVGKLGPAKSILERENQYREQLADIRRMFGTEVGSGRERVKSSVTTVVSTSLLNGLSIILGERHGGPVDDFVAENMKLLKESGAGFIGVEAPHAFQDIYTRFSQGGYNEAELANRLRVEGLQENSIPGAVRLASAAREFGVPVVALDTSYMPIDISDNARIPVLLGDRIFSSDPYMAASFNTARETYGKPGVAIVGALHTNNRTGFEALAGNAISIDANTVKDAKFDSYDLVVQPVEWSSRTDPARESLSDRNSTFSVVRNENSMLRLEQPVVK